MIDNVPWNKRVRWIWRKRMLRLLLYRYIQLVIAIGSSKDGKL